jgi:hypothetical protein
VKRVIRLVAGLAAVAASLPGTAARADGSAYDVTASCGTTQITVFGPVLVRATAQAGTSPRPISTDVTCIATMLGGNSETFQGSLPGAVAVLVDEVYSPLERPDVCVTASVYWADGVRTTTATACGAGSATVEGSS